MKEMDALMEDNCNAERVNAKLVGDFTDLCIDFCAVNDAVKDHMTEEEAHQDKAKWYDPKASQLKAFQEKVEGWLKRVKQQEEEARMVDAEVEPADSASRISEGSFHDKSNTSRPGSGVSSATSSARIKIEAERAALVARAEALKRKQEIESEEALKQKKRNGSCKQLLLLLVPNWRCLQ